MNFTLLVNVLLFLACFKLFGNWEIPINLGFDPLKVTGGFPAFITANFENFFDLENSKRPDFPLGELPYSDLTSEFTRFLNWSCPILESSSQCISLMTSSKCTANSQFSYSFWDISTECYHRKTGIFECKIPFLRGNLCENIVVAVKKDGILELDDFPLGTQITQNYIDDSEKFSLSENSTISCQNYTRNDFVMIGGENGTDIFPLFSFGINSTQLAKDLSCTPPFPSDVFLCNCLNSPECQVPILYLTENATYCGSTTLSIFHTHGFIYSAVVTSSDSESQSRNIKFYDLVQSAPKSKFELQRGRFHCPSEVTCIAEILYPFGFLDSLDFPYQIGIFIFSAIIGISIIVRLNRK